MGFETEELCEQTLVEGDKAVKLASKAVNSTKDNKTHVCTYSGCSARFNRPSRLKQHLQTHEGKVKFKIINTGSISAI